MELLPPTSDVTNYFHVFHNIYVVTKCKDLQFHILINILYFNEINLLKVQVIFILFKSIFIDIV